jgi:hypothetical protein
MQQRSTKKPNPWPYRLALARAAWHAQADAIGSLVAGLDPLPRSYPLRKDGEDLVIFAFADSAQEELFRTLFGGTSFSAWTVG